MTAAEDVERQVTIAIVIAVEKAAFLMTVQRIVGRIQIENDLLRSTTMRRQEHIDKQPLDRRRIVADLVIPRRLTTAQLQPVQRRFPRQWRAIRPLGLQLARQNRQHRIMSEFIEIIEVLIAQRDANDPLLYRTRFSWTQVCC